MTVLSKVALLGLAATAAPAAGETGPRPVALEVEQDERGVRLNVVGTTDVETEVRYELEVDSGAGNRVRQASSARLIPGKPQRLSTVAIGSKQYRARLVVQTDGGSYQSLLTSKD